ncbi:MAG: T9SS type A sorting domain-containing protein, partial [Gemmatimonadetes bacterium]|nr:T9SS type A sorting domain-containing protein [Gemmatimonadota bacterium]
DCSITGGFVYRGAAIPHLYGHYLYGDFCSRRVWAMRAEPDTVLDIVDLTPQIDPVSVLQTVTSIVRDGFGEPYIIDRTGSVNTGRLYRLGADFVGLPGGEGRGSNDTRVTTGSAMPNPFREVVRFEVSGTNREGGRFAVYDVRGRLVRSVSESQTGRVIEWNGRDDDGNVLPAGVYFLRFESNGRVETRRVTFLR